VVFSDPPTNKNNSQSLWMEDYSLT